MGGRERRGRMGFVEEVKKASPQCCPKNKNKYKKKKMSIDVDD